MKIIQLKKQNKYVYALSSGNTTFEYRGKSIDGNKHLFLPLPLEDIVLSSVGGGILLTDEQVESHITAK